MSSLESLISGEAIIYPDVLSDLESDVEFIGDEERYDSDNLDGIKIKDCSEEKTVDASDDRACEDSADEKDVDKFMKSIDPDNYNYYDDSIYNVYKVGVICL